MSKFVDLTNKRVGDWLVIERAGSTKNKAVLWKCKCLSCGKEKNIVSYSLIQGTTTRCRSCSAFIFNKKEFMSNDPVHIVYSGMKQRCYDKNYKHYENYGGRGIKVCDEWKNDFQSFAKWCYENGYKKGLTIDRINVDGNYEPSNCRFITNAEQQSNKRNTNYVLVNSEFMCVSQACKKYNIRLGSVGTYKAKHGCSYQEAFEHILEYQKSRKYHRHIS